MIKKIGFEDGFDELRNSICTGEDMYMYIYMYINNSNLSKRLYPFPPANDLHLCICEAM
jgi:hypothetical protein